MLLVIAATTTSCRASVVGSRADDDGGAELPARFVGDNEPDEDDISAPEGGHIPRLSGCLRALRGPDRPLPSASASPRCRRRDLLGAALRSLRARTHAP